MEEIQTILSTVLLGFQFVLALWQIVKFTPVGGYLKGVIGWLLSLLPFPCLSPAYALLQHSPGRVFKNVHCAVLKNVAGSQDDLWSITPLGFEGIETTNVSYFGVDCHLERRDGEKLYVNGKMTYYITDELWQDLLSIFKGTKICRCGMIYMYVNGYKEFWELRATGGVMKLSEALDCILLENHTVMVSDNDRLLPVNLSLSEEKLLKLLNLVGLFLNIKKVFWLIPIFMSFVSALLEFNTTLRSWLYTKIYQVFCWSLHLLCGKLSYSLRRQVYALGKWVENLKPCNDIQLRVVTGTICAVIGGGAKADKEDADKVDWLNVEETRKAFELTDKGASQAFKLHGEGTSRPGETTLVRKCTLEETNDEGRKETILFKCWLGETNDCSVSVKYPNGEEAKVKAECNSKEKFTRICTFVDCMARNASGSLKSYDSKTKKVQVRGWKESVRHYVKAGCPEIYELKLQDVIVSGN